ncbi:hypothetical protein ILYODFUR_014641 [Ilyodon furcidens]|uniref:Secreted protein n=1 Tax=Ilyodon furcidens TaxID=33524 RepID=A0ABV0U5I6_9TELE
MSQWLVLRYMCFAMAILKGRLKNSVPTVHGKSANDRNGQDEWLYCYASAGSHFHVYEVLATGALPDTANLHKNDRALKQLSLKGAQNTGT